MHAPPAHHRPPARITPTRLAHDERGGVAVVFALVSIPILLAVGMSVDLARAYSVKTRMLTALDAAALAVGRADPASSPSALQVTANKHYKANYPDDKIGRKDPVKVVVRDSKVTVSTAVEVDTLFMKIFGKTSITVHNETEVTRANKSLEVALAFDVTGSMSANDSPGYASRMEAAKDAARTLVDQLLPAPPVPGVVDPVRIAIVPFSASVNVGTGNRALLNAFSDGLYTTHGTSWKGCVVERAYPGDVTDVPASSTATRWTHYLWPVEALGDESADYNQWGDRGVMLCPNPRATKTVCTRWAGTTCLQSAVAADYSRYAKVDDNAVGGFDYGPNKGCPPQAVVPLTSDKTTLLNTINAFTPLSGGGTLTHLGLAWAWRTLSPGAPFTQGRAYNNAKNVKAVIVMTDGENNINEQKASSQEGCGRSGEPEAQRAHGDYTGVGYAIKDPADPLDVGTTGTNGAVANRAEVELNKRTEEVCDNIKEADADNPVIIYAITVGDVGGDVEQRFRNKCASSRDKYFHAPTGAELKGIFKLIAQDLSSLRISR